MSCKYTIWNVDDTPEVQNISNKLMILNNSNLPQTTCTKNALNSLNLARSFEMDIAYMRDIEYDFSIGKKGLHMGTC